MRINQNIAAFNSYRNLNQTQSQLSSSLEKLSSGFRINRAADDAAGLVNSENLRAQIGGLKVATRNAQDAISLVQTAEGAQTEVHSILQRMRDLVVQSGNIGTNDAAALKANNDEIGQLKQELTRISEQTQFGTKKILDGTFAKSDAVPAIVNQAVTLGGFTTTPGAAGDPSAAVWAADALTPPAGYEGNLVFTVGGGGITTAEVTVAAGASLADIASAFDAVTGLGATVSGNNINFATTGNSDVALTLTVANVSQAEVPAKEGAVFQVGANASQTVAVGINSVKASALGMKADGSAATYTDAAGAAATSQFASVENIDFTGLSGDGLATAVADALATLDQAISNVSDNRATLGAFQNRMESTIRNVGVAVENLSAAESRIRDTDMAQEMVSFTRAQILSQAGTAMLAQANQVPQAVLSLLR